MMLIDPPIAGGLILGVPLSVATLVLLVTAVHRDARWLRAGWLVSTLNILWQVYYILHSMYGHADTARRLMVQDVALTLALWIGLPGLFTTVRWLKQRKPPTTAGRVR